MPILKDIERLTGDKANNATCRFQRQGGNIVSSQSDSLSVESPGSASAGLSSFDLNINEEGIGGTSTERPIGVKKSKRKKKK